MDFDVVTFGSILASGILGFIITKGMSKFLEVIGSISNMSVPYIMSKFSFNRKFIEVNLVFILISFVFLSFIITKACAYYSTRLLSYYCPSKCTHYTQLSKRSKDKYKNTIRNCSKNFEELDLKLKIFIVVIGITWLIILAGFLTVFSCVTK